MQNLERQKYETKLQEKTPEQYKQYLQNELNANTLRFNNFTNPEKKAKAEAKIKALKELLLVDTLFNDTAKTEAKNIQDQKNFSIYNIGSTIDNKPKDLNFTKEFIVKYNQQIYKINVLDSTIRILNITNAGLKGLECPEYTFQTWLYDHEFSQRINRYLIHQVNFYYLLDACQNLTEHKNKFILDNPYYCENSTKPEEQKTIELNLYYSRIKAINVFRFFDLSIYKPLAEVPKKWTMPHIIRVLVNDQCLNLRQTYHFRHESNGIVNNCLELVKEIVTDQCKWEVNQYNINDNNISFGCRYINSYSFLFTLEKRKDTSMKFNFAKFNKESFRKNIESKVKSLDKKIEDKKASVRGYETKTKTAKRCREQSKQENDLRNFIKDQNYYKSLLAKDLNETDFVNNTLLNNDKFKYRYNRFVESQESYKDFSIIENSFALDFLNSSDIPNDIKQAYNHNKNVPDTELIKILSLLKSLPDYDKILKTNYRLETIIEYLRLFKLLQHYNITTKELLIQKYNELTSWLESLDVQENTVNIDMQIKDLERQAILQQKQYTDFYPTSKAVVLQMIDGYDLNNKTVLEPSAGTGNILDVIKEENPDVILTCNEISNHLCSILKMKGYEPTQQDFAEFETNERFDYVIMNPPFSSYQEHIKKAFDLLKDGGTLKAIAPPNFIRSSRKAFQEFETFVNDNGYVEKLPEASFKLGGTMVSSVIITLEKR